MNIVQPYATPLTIKTREQGIEMLRRIEAHARVAYRSEDKITEDSYDRLLRSVVMQRGHFSVTEHETITCEFVVDRGVTHEIVRHRLAAYTQESTRFCNYGKKSGEITVIEPLDLNDTAKILWRLAMQHAEAAYLELLQYGCSPQIARSVLPNALASKIIVTYNLRTWRHFFLLRTSKEAHPQMREVTVPLLSTMQKLVPILFEDIEPLASQTENMRKLC